MILDLLFILCECPLAYMHVYHIYSTQRGQGKALAPLEVEIQVTVSHHVDAGNRTQILFAKSSKCS